MEDNEDEPEDVRKATPVEEEIRRGEIDEPSVRPAQSFVASTRKRHRCEKNISKKKSVKTEGECCRAKLAKAARAPKTATVLVYEKECNLPKVKAVPRHCLSKDEWIDILATPSRKCPSPCLRKAVTRKIRPVSARMAELAQPPKQRLLRTLQDRGGTLPTELVDNLIQSLEGETCLTPEQAERMFRDRDNRAAKEKKKCRKKNGARYKSSASGSEAEPGVASNVSSLDRDAVHCQYLMAESFVKSILEWKCQIPREEFKDIADVVLKRLGCILEYGPSNGEDRKSQQMRFLADIVASWIAGVLIDVAEERKTELEEDRERRRREKEEETEEDSEDESDGEDDDGEDDDDDEERPKGRGDPPRKGKDDERKKGDKGGKDDDDDEDKKRGEPGKEKGAEGISEAGGLEGATDEVTEEPPSKSRAEDETQPREMERESKGEEETFFDARTEPASPTDVDGKKTLAREPEDAKKMAEGMSEERAVNGKIEETEEDGIQDGIPKNSTVEKSPKPEDASAKVEALTRVAKGEGDEGAAFDDRREKALDASEIRDSVKVASGIGKRDDDDEDATGKKSVDASQSAEMSEEMKAADAFVDYSRRSAEVKESTELKSSSPEKSGTTAAAEIAKVVEPEKEVVVAGLPTDERAAGDKIDDGEAAAKPARIPEVSVTLEAKREAETGASTVPVDSGDAGTKARKDSTAASPVQDSSIPIRVGQGDFDKDEEKRMSIEAPEDPSRLVPAESKEDGEPKRVVEPFEDRSRSARAEEPKGKVVDSREDDEAKKSVEPYQDPSRLVTMEALRDKRKGESERRRPSRGPSSGKAPIGRILESDVPFVTFDKIFHTVYNAIEASNENSGGDAITNRIHRAVYEKCSNVVREENPGPLPELTKDVLDVMSGKIALWLRNLLTDSQLSFVNKFPATVESADVREWSNWIGNVSDTANNWSAWIRQTIRQAEGMRSHEVTRGDWRDWTKSVEIDALRWRRFYLESLHQAHQNLTMIRDRHVVKTDTRHVDEPREEYEEEMKITDLEVER